MCVILLTVLLCQARNALIALTGGVLTGNMYYAFRHSLKMRAALDIKPFLPGAILVSGLLWVYVNPDGTVWVLEELQRISGMRTHRLQWMIEGDAHQASAGRLVAWPYYLDDIARGVWFAGPNQAQHVSTLPISPHNMYIAAIIDLGPPIVVFFVVYFSRVHKLLTAGIENRYLYGFVAFMLFLAIGNDVLYYKYFWFATWLFVVGWAWVQESGVHGLSNAACRPHRNGYQ